VNQTSTEETSTKEDQTLIEETSTKEDQTDDVIPQSTSSASSSRSNSISNQSSEQLQPGHPGIRTRSITEDKSNNQDDAEQDQSNFQKQMETLSIDSESTVNIFI